MNYRKIKLDAIIPVPAPPKGGQVEQIYAIKVRPVAEKFEIVDGHGRYWQAVGREETEIWANVQTMDDHQFHLESLAANLMTRENPMKAAIDIRHLLTVEGYTQQELARKIGCSQGEISKLNALNGLPDLLKARILNGDCPKEAARIALELPEEFQIELGQAEKITIELVRQYRNRFKGEYVNLSGMSEPVETPEFYLPEPVSKKFVLNGNSYDRLQAGETVEAEWDGLRLEIRAL